MNLVVDGHPVFIATGGRPFDPERPTVVFLHGAGCDRTSWMQPARWFAHHGWSVLAPDLPGHGRSGGAPLTSIGALAAWTLDLLKAAGAGKAALVGHSMGGAIALEAAAAAPATVEHITLVGTAAVIPVNPSLIETARTAPADAYDMMTTWALAPAARIGGNRMPGVHMWGVTRSIFGTCKPDVLAIDLEACNAWKTGLEAARSIGCRADVILAEFDMMTPMKRGRELAAAIAGATLTVLPRTGHMIPLEAPDAFLDALIAAYRPAKAA